MKLMSHAAIISLFVISAAAERGCEKTLPVWRGKIYVANSVEAAIVRRQDNEVIKANSVEFGEFFCIRKTSFDCFTETFLINCKEYGKQSACGLEINN